MDSSPSVKSAISSFVPPPNEEFPEKMKSTALRAFFGPIEALKGIDLSILER